MKHFSINQKFLIIGCLTLTGFQLQGQTTVNINQNMEHVQQNCVVPANVDFYFSALTTNYTLTDSIDFHLDYGDGNYTNQRVAQNFFSTTEAFTSFNSGNYITHTYLTQGIFIVTYIASLPDGNADTVIVPVMITTTCNNITGRVYVDVNQDCSFNAGDLPMQIHDIRLSYNGQAVFYGFTDNQGLFTLNALPGYTYSLIEGATTDPQLAWSCSTTQSITVTPNPSTNQDFIIRDSTAMQLLTSLDTTSGTCIPLYADLTAVGTTFLYSSPNDSADLYVDFGDAHDTLVKCPIYNNSGLFGTFSYSFSHIYTTIGNFNVTYVATTQDGHSDTIVRMNTIIAIDTCVVSGIIPNEIKSNALSIYPNPASSTVEIKFQKSLGAIVILTDVLGNKISETQLNSNASILDVSGVPTGIYFVSIENSQEIIVRKIIVQH